MFYENYPKFLDSILKCFSDDINREKTVEELKSIVFKKEISKRYDINKPDKNISRLFNETLTYSEYLIFSLNFLTQEGLVNYDAVSQTIKITSKGFVKIKIEGFAEEVNNKKINLCLQRITWLCAIATLLITIFIQFLRPAINSFSNCNCEYLYQKIDHQSKNKP